MNHQKQIAENISPYLFFIRFCLLFVILYLFFPFYWGIIGPGGKIYSSFLAENFNIIKGFSSFLTGSARLLLNALGYDSFQRQYNALRIGHSRGVVVNPSCLGWAVLSFWTAFVYANSGTVGHKLKWILTGCITITFINIVRIALIVLANHLNWSFIIHLDHHKTFNIASYGCMFVFMFFYIKRQKKYERMNIDLQSAKNFTTAGSRLSK